MVHGACVPVMQNTFKLAYTLYFSLHVNYTSTSKPLRDIMLMLEEEILYRKWLRLGVPPPYTLTEFIMANLSYDISRQAKECHGPGALSSACLREQ